MVVCILNYVGLSISVCADQEYVYSIEVTPELNWLTTCRVVIVYYL